MEKYFCPYCMSTVKSGEPCPVCGLTSGAYTPLPHHLPPGTVLMDRYLVGRVLGEGGFGITYIGCDLRLELKVAIKEYFPTDKATRHAQTSLTVSSYIGAAAGGYTAGKERFLNEARTMARMDKQPQIVSVRDFFEANNTAYIVMEYVDGTTFKELVSQRGGRIPPAELLPMMEPLFTALSAVHERGLIHRDISPDNLMLENGALRLLDFGCARESSRGTETMTIALKHGYAPIEQYQHKGQGPWTDVYGLAATLYYCLTGKTPPQALDRLCEDELILPRKLGVVLTERQEKALLYGMGIRPRRRFQSVEEFRTALYEVEVPLPTPPEAEPEESMFAEPVREFPKIKLPQGEVKPGDVTVIEPLFEPTPLPVSEPIPQTDPSPEPDDLPVPTPEPIEAAAQEPSQEPPVSLPRDKKKWIIPGIAAAVVVVAAVLLAVFLPRGDNPAVESPDPGSTSPQPSTTPPTNTDPFEGAVELDRDSHDMAQQLSDLMNDDSVSAIIIPADCGSLALPDIAITKPLLVSAGTELDLLTPSVAITGEGYLLVDGMLAVDSAVTVSHGGRLEVTETGILAGGGLLWAYSEDDFIFRGQFLEMTENQMIFANPEALFVTSEEDIFDGAAVVTTYGQLVQRNSWGQSIIIPSGTTIELASGFNQHVPILIEEGAVVHSSHDAPWAVENALLLNRGTVDGHIWTSNAKIINEGTLAPTEALFLESNSTLFNRPSGEIALPTMAHFGVGSYTLNLGAITGHVQLIGGRMLNNGSIVNTGKDELGFDVHAGSNFTNRTYGTVDIYGNFWSDSHVFNGGGTITIHEGAGFGNCNLFENEGSLYLEQADHVWNSGIVRWFEIGYVDQPERLEHLIYDNSSHDWNCGLPVETISTAEELLAWAERGNSAATLSEHITLDCELSVTCPLDIPGGTSLAVDRLNISGTTVRLGGQLNAKAVCVADGALLHAIGGIYIYEGGLFELDRGGSLIFEGRDFDLSQASLRLFGGSNVYIAYTDQIDVAYVDIQHDSHLISMNGSLFEGSKVTVRDGQIQFPNGMYCHEIDFTLEDGTITVTGLDLQSGSLNISGGTFITHENVRLGDGVTIINHGQFNSNGDSNFHSVQVEGSIENYGNLCANTVSIEIHGQLYNEGNLYYGWGGSITGNISGRPAEKNPESD